MFQPVLPSSGLSGWQFLQRTYDRQLETFNQSVALKRDTEYFAENISSVTSAEDLVADRRLLTVALGAFGLQDDINNSFFIQKMLSDGTTADDALANRFTDSRYQDFSAAFGLGPGEIPGALSPDFAGDIIARFQANSFEVATGAQDDTMRIALYAERTMGEVVGTEGSDASKWFTIMGQPPLRSLFETALGLPTAFGQVDIDQQLTVFQDRSAEIFGVTDPSQFADPEVLDNVISTYFARSQLSSFGNGASGAAIALTLLSS
ncbi:DUF1217 domain-containing protein [uncultured Tateyamaria sp.]|uniref:DUF1217 domain-containing protein n=1 Tax=uncultured Tateyamaria sp. TaxID=455651 RepID=UPI00260F2465|nr:DUF1217 domain-containing protein [uncultured Tateyamaria sp.]